MSLTNSNTQIENISLLNHSFARQIQAEKLLTEGFISLSGTHLLLEMDEPKFVEQLSAYWKSLDIDHFLHDGGEYRKRRIGKFSYYCSSDRLIHHPKDISFFQSKQYNPVNGGLDRYFSPLEPGFAQSTFLHRLIRYCLRLIPLKGTNLIKITTHMFRVTCNTASIGFPTPEGIHQDGHHYVSQHLISRYQVQGGISGIYDLEERPLLHYQLHYPMDSILINDTLVKHDVSPIFPKFCDQEGYRDMLVIDYNLVDRE